MKTLVDSYIEPSCIGKIMDYISASTISGRRVLNMRTKYWYNSWIFYARNPFYNGHFSISNPD